MTPHTDELRALALDMIAPRRQPAPALLARMSADAWKELIEIARQHRILPLMHDRLRGAGRDWLVPAPVRSAAAASFRQHGMRAVRVQYALLQSLRALAAAGISVTALKGSWLAFHAYPQPALRPMRDIDLLVDRDKAIAAYDTLRRAGFQPAAGNPGDLHAYVTLKHQLPALRCPHSGIVTELHHRCFHGSDGTADLTEDPAFAARLILGELGGVPLNYVGREHQLLHLIVHSALDHQFDNGPGIFADIAMVIAGRGFDWGIFWDAAARFGAEPAAELTLRLAQEWWGAAPIDWQGRCDPAEPLPGDIVDAVKTLCLRGRDGNHRIAVQAAFSNQHGFAGKARYLAAKLLPPAQVLRAAYPSNGSTRDLPRLYVLRWRDMIRRHRVQFDQSEAKADLRKLSQVNRWLECSTATRSPSTVMHRSNDDEQTMAAKRGAPTIPPERRILEKIDP